MSSTAVRPVGVHFGGDLRRALIDAAAGVLDEVGADRLSLRDVARRLGVSHAAPAHHFGDKAGLLTAVATEGFAMFVEHLVAAVVASPVTDPVAQLPALARAYAEFAERNPGRFDVMFRPALTRPDDAEYTAASDLAFDVLLEHMRSCQRAGWLPEADSRTLAAAAWSLAHGISVLRNNASLAKHAADASLDGVEAITAMLVPAARTGQ